MSDHDIYTEKFENALRLVPLSELQAAIVKGRYIPMLHHIRVRTYRTGLVFHSSRIVITIGSLVVPALLSIQGFGTTNKEVYWTTWTISLLVTVCNALVALFKFDKRYYSLHTILERLVSEGWQYIELTGKYSGYYTRGTIATHENQFVYFSHSVEKIRMKQVEDEYYKSEAESQKKPTTQEKGLVPPTPQQGDLAAVPPAISMAVHEQLSQQEVDGGEKNKKSKEDRAPQSVSVCFDM